MNRFMTTVVVAVLAGIVVGAAVLITYMLVDDRNPKPFDPLRYPDTARGGQTVLSRVPGVIGPAVHLGSHVRVRGTACNVAGRPVAITGRLFWTIVRPPGVSLLISEADAFRQSGCVTFDFSNPMPPAVRDIARARPNVLWRINGDAAPVEPHGVRRYWQTQEFRIVP